MRIREILSILLLLAVPAAAQTDVNGLVVLLTDYGADSVYVGALKGAIYAKYPDARIDSLTNSVPAFDIMSGAFLLAEWCDAFPKGTTFCCVVDPGVGTERRVIAMKTESGHLFVAPDNGLLTLVADRLGVVEVREGENRALWRNFLVSATFHGRDIFGPIAASLAGGVPLDKLGSVVTDMVRLDIPKSEVNGETVKGAVIRIDRYGNIVTNITRPDLAAIGLQAGDSLDISIGNATFTAPLKRQYRDVGEGERLALFQSSGYLECAVNLGSLADALGEELRAPVTVRKAK